VLSPRQKMLWRSYLVPPAGAYQRCWSSWRRTPSTLYTNGGAV